MHRNHHSNRQKETDSNYGTILSIWDRLLGAFRGDVEPDESKGMQWITAIQQ